MYDFSDRPSAFYIFEMRTETEVISFLMRLILVVYGCADKVWRASIRITEICWMCPARYISTSALLLFNVLNYCWLNSVLAKFCACLERQDAYR